MNIVLATPLYPPDTALSALYVKELARRLSGEHSVTIVTYGSLPERVAGVRIIAISKHQPLILRIFDFTVALIALARKADVVYFENGASVELPVAVASLFVRRLYFMHVSDAGAHKHAESGGVFGLIERSARGRATEVLTETPVSRPEVLPFAPPPAEEIRAFGASWDTHLARLKTLFHHA